MKKSDIIFICNICGMRAPEPVLCVKESCPTPLLVYAPSDKPCALLPRPH